MASVVEGDDESPVKTTRGANYSSEERLALIDAWVEVPPPAILSQDPATGANQTAEVLAERIYASFLKNGRCPSRAEFAKTSGREAMRWYKRVPRTCKNTIDTVRKECGKFREFVLRIEAMELTGTPPDDEWILKCAQLMYSRHKNKDENNGTDRSELYKIIRGEDDAPKYRKFAYLCEYMYFMSAPARAMILNSGSDALSLPTGGNTGGEKLDSDTDDASRKRRPPGQKRTKLARKAEQEREQVATSGSRTAPAVEALVSTTASKQAEKYSKVTTESQAMQAQIEMYKTLCSTAGEYLEKSNKRVKMDEAVIDSFMKFVQKGKEPDGVGDAQTDTIPPQPSHPKTNDSGNPIAAQEESTPESDEGEQ